MLEQHVFEHHLDVLYQFHQN